MSVHGLLLRWGRGGEQGLDFSGMAANIRDNPLSYGLAFAGAISGRPIAR
ncbi:MULTISPECIES: hypothetical protein [unclassified Pseudomonas]|jgi:hypothetical protein|nr:MULTISPECIES: hypothetical protein [unclassified Pseudomonas]WPP47201.1 hypothetical protein SK095_07410 [Pseudomonas sp. AN-1]